MLRREHVDADALDDHLVQVAVVTAVQLPAGHGRILLPQPAGHGPLHGVGAGVRAGRSPWTLSRRRLGRRAR